MSLIEKLKESKVFKIFFCIGLLLIIFDKVIIHVLKSKYKELKKLVLKNDIESPLETIKKYTNKNSEKFNNLD